MGGLSNLLCCSALIVAAADPAPVTVSVKVAATQKVQIRLVFKQGIQVEARGLPSSYVSAKPAGSAWLSLESLTEAGRRWALQSLWPDDEWRKEEVLHHVRWPELESVWLLAQAFTGHGQNYDALMEANARLPEKMRKGDVWRIPKGLWSIHIGGSVRGVLQRAMPEEALEDDARIDAYRAMLTFGEYKGQRVATYRLRKGEALYTSVVMRYTDRVDPKDVNVLAQELAKLSDIEDVKSIAPGTLVRIPVAYLAAPFQPEGTTALAEEREIREEVRRTTRLQAGPKLRGVTVVLDAGHGGIDVGAQANGAWESDFVYDITLRVRRMLEQETECQVSSTIRYPGVGFKVRDRIIAPTREAHLLTTPPFANDGEHPNAVSVHLRWVLANDILADHRGDAKQTLFISFHADSLHPSAIGTMVYVPGAPHVPNSFALGVARLAKVKEVRRGARVSFSAKERLQGEARSRLFAETLLQQLRKRELPIHANRPIRNVIHRGGKGFLPAVIRYNMAATKVLVEVANLQNEEDAANLKSAAFRERYAEAVVESIRAYFGKAAGSSQR